MTSSDKMALVTGAAARIGAAIASALHGRGFDVLVHCNSNREAADGLASRLNGERPDSAWVVSADISTIAGVDSLVEQTLARSESLDLLVNNASRFYPTEVGQTQLYQWDDLINSNLRGPYFLCQGLMAALAAAGGSIVNIVDIHAARPMAGHAAYCISKAGLAMMTRSLAKELGPEVRVNGVSPGAILWPENAAESSSTAAQQQNILNRTVLGRLGEPSDIASAVTWLALDAPYVTGHIISVDGGRLLNI